MRMTHTHTMVVMKVMVKKTVKSTVKLESTGKEYSQGYGQEYGQELQMVKKTMKSSDRSHRLENTLRPHNTLPDSCISVPNNEACWMNIGTPGREHQRHNKPIML